MKNLVFIGNYGNRNIGDDAILSVLSDRYMESLPNYKQYVFSRYYSEDIDKISNAKPLNMSLKSIIWVLANCQMIVIGGGGIFSAYTGPIAKLIPFFAILCKLLFKRVVYESIGFYATSSNFEKFFVLLSMVFADSVSVRDEASVKSTRLISSIRKIELVDDPGLSIKPINSTDVQKILMQEKVNLEKSGTIIGISVKRLKDDQDRHEFTSHLVEFLNEVTNTGKFTFIFIPFCHDKEKFNEKDLEYSKEISKNILNESKYIIENYYTPKQIAGLIKELDLLIAMRFHSIVFGHALNVDMIPISYEEKCKSFILKYDYPLIEAKDFNSSRISSLFPKLPIYDQG